MSRFNRPNPDQWSVSDVAYRQEFTDGVLRMEIWENDGESVWVLVIDPGGHSGQNEHTPLTDAMAAMMLRVMRGD